MGKGKGIRLWILLIACALALTAIRFTAGGLPQGHPLSRLAQTVLTPFQGAVSRVVASVRDSGSFIVHLGDLRRENAALRADVDRLTLVEAQMEELRQENVRLREFLNFQSRRPWLGDVDLYAVRVLARNPDNWFSTATVDRGEQAGVRKGWIALTPQGLAGRVTGVSGRSATVLLLTDPQSGVGAMVQRETSRAQGVVLGLAGRGDLLKMRFFQRNADVRRGERIVTSDLGDAYPPGIPIGTVTEVFEGENGLVRYAWVKPAVDFDRLQRLFLIPDESRPAAPDSQDGQAQGE